MRSDATNDTPHGGVTVQLSDSEPHCDSDARESDAMNNPPIHARVLVIDDNDAARLALVHALARDFTVTEAASIATALQSIATAPSRYDAVVCDLKMDAPSAPLHDVLSHHRMPVVLISGVESERLPETARRYGWRYIAKPCDPDALVSAVYAAISSAERASRESGERLTVAPSSSPAIIVQSPTSAPAIESAVRDGGVHYPRETTPAEGSPRATVPMSDRARIHDDWSRRLKHVVIGLCITGLTLYGQRTGHPVEWYVVAVLGALGVGPEAVKNALTARPKAAVAGVAGLVALAVAGDALNVSQLGALSSLGVAALPFVDRAATAVNLTE